MQRWRGVTDSIGSLVSGVRAWRARRHLVNVFLEHPLILVVETTGLGPMDQVIEICLVDSHSLTSVFRSRFDPTVPIRRDAERQHGISSASLPGMPTFAHLSPEVNKVLKGRSIIAFDLASDLRLLRQTYAAFDLEVPSVGMTASLLGIWGAVHGKRVPLMKAYGKALGLATGGKPETSFEKALAISGVLWSLLPKEVRTDCLEEAHLVRSGV